DTLTNSLSLIGPRRSNSSRRCRWCVSNRSTCSIVYLSCCTATASCISTATLHRLLHDLQLCLNPRVVPVHAKVHHPRERPVVVLVEHALPRVEQGFERVVRVPAGPIRPPEPQIDDHLLALGHQRPSGFKRRLPRRPCRLLHPRLGMAGDNVHGAALVREPPVHVIDAGWDAWQHYPQRHRPPTILSA